MKVFIVFAVSIAALAAEGFASQETGERKRTKVDKRSPWQLVGSYYGGFGDSLARSDGHVPTSYSEQQQFGSGGSWQQDYQPQAHQWAQAGGLEPNPAKSVHPVHEWHAERGPPQVHFDEHGQRPQFHFEASYQPQTKVEPSFDWQHQNLRLADEAKGWQQQQHQQQQQQHQQLLQQLQHHGGSSQEWSDHDEVPKESGGGSDHGDWAPVSGGSSSEHETQSHTTETKEEHHHEWSAPVELKEEKHEDDKHHHTKIIKVPYPVHIEKPYPVYIEKPYIVEKPVPLKLYIKKKHH